ncbi:DUF4142 domain-containing protein [Roseixanthobacter pseudopolyaromaticivorans]|uniref:DUF4142 domain-containing protein n=1 Tax=Xanthobacteraceae TaxID=335928 RepID=UPI00372B7341
MSKLSNVLVAVALLAGVPAASAQTMNMPASTTASSAGPSPADIAKSATVPTTPAFVDTAARANQFEIVTSQVALEKSKNKKVLAFAKKMVKDHTKIGKNFGAAFGKANTGLTLPTGLGDDFDKTLARLKSEDGATFDADYIAVQTKGHQDAVGLFAGYAKGGDNPTLKAFAKKTLPIIEMHLKMCYDLAKLKL